jgi:hypothetical protein
MRQTKDKSKTLKEILSTDYRIPGIRPRFYLPVILLVLAAEAAYIWTPNIHYADWAVAIAVFVVCGVSIISTTVQRILRLLHRK